MESSLSGREIARHYVQAGKIKVVLFYPLNFFKHEIHEKNETDERIVLRFKNLRLFRVFRVKKSKNKLTRANVVSCQLIKESENCYFFHPFYRKA